MKVGISYAVELEDVPEEVENLLRDVQWDLRTRLEGIIAQVASGNFSKLGEDIKSIRSDLVKTDTRLEDCYTILARYVKVLNGLAEQAATPTEVVTPSRPIPAVKVTDEHDSND